MIVGGEDSDLYRLNLETGQFLASLELSYNGGCNKLAMSDNYPLLAAGGVGGIVDFYDMRNKSRVSSLMCDSNRSDMEVSVCVVVVAVVVI